MTRSVRLLAVVTLAAAPAACGERADTPRPSAAAAQATAQPELRYRSGVGGLQPREGFPLRAGGARLITLPRFGTLSWRCSARGGTTRYATELRVPRNAGTVRGSVQAGAGAAQRFTLSPGDAVGTRLLTEPRVTWIARWRHPPRPRTLRVRIDMRYDGGSSECVLGNVQAEVTDRP